MIEKRLETPSESVKEISSEILKLIKSSGYIDRNNLMKKFSLSNEELQQIFNQLEEKGYLKSILKECRTNACKGCPYIAVCGLGKVKFYVLSE